ncbi:glucomannan 4-beta-mannosyltransferase 9-like protein [Tanacetum coccineum]
MLGLNGAWFFEPKREWGGRGVNEKDHVGVVKDVVSPSVIDESVVKEKQCCLADTSIPPTGTSSMSKSDGTLNDAIPRVSKEVVSPSVVKDTVEKEKLSPVVTTTESYPPLPTQVTTSAGNAFGKSLYAYVTGKPSGKKLNFCTLFTPGVNGIDVVVPVESIRTISERFANTLVRSMFSSSTGLLSFQFSSMEGLDVMLENGPWFIRNNLFILRKWHPDENLLKEDVSTIPVWDKLHGVPITAFSEDGLSAIATKLGTPLMLDSYTTDMCMQSWGRSSYARAMIELRADVELKDNIVAAMHKITRRATIFECLNNIGAGATKNLKKTSQTPKGIPVGQKMGFKPKQVFQHVSKKSTANTYGKKKINSESTKEVSTNGGISNSADKGTINASSSNTAIGVRVARFLDVHVLEECLKNIGVGATKNLKKTSQTSKGIPVGQKMGFKPKQVFQHISKKSTANTYGKKKINSESTKEVSKSNIFEVLTSVDNDVDLGTNGGISNSADKGTINVSSSNTPIVKVVFGETANLRLSTSDKDGSDKGYGTNSLLEQWRNSYPDNDDYDPYDDDMYENHDMSEHIQSICDDLDITIRGRKKK